MLRITLILICCLSFGCAYRFGLSERSLPGGYAQLAIPVFKNLTQEVGVEVPFTNALVREFARSKVARISDRESAPMILEGRITNITTNPGAAVTNKPGQLTTLPNDAVLTTEYRLVVKTDMLLRRKSDEKIIWEGSFSNEIVYSAPRIGQAVVNSANANYNQSVRFEKLSRLADEMMSEAHDRITENF